MTATDRETMLLDGLLASFDATRIEHRVLPCGLAEAYEGGAPGRLHARVARVRRGPRALRPARGRRAGRGARAQARRPSLGAGGRGAAAWPSMPTHGDWVLLGEDPPSR